MRKGEVLMTEEQKEIMLERERLERAFEREEKVAHLQTLSDELSKVRQSIVDAGFTEDEAFALLMELIKKM
jgi:hypothetical protein